jgi:sterol desaturase/sphingolipid hydroxylase (fatty acid hydroxylase superfamily)
MRRRPHRFLLLLATLMAAGSLVTAALEVARRLLAGEPPGLADLPFSPFEEGAGIMFMVVGAVLAAEAAWTGWQASGLARLADEDHLATRSDLLWFLIEISGLGVALMVLASAGGTLLLENAFAAAEGWRLVAGWPLALQVLALLLLGDVGQYWAHRALHSRWLWPFHAMHHAAEELTPLSTFRSHPLESVLTRLASGMLPLLILGPDPEAVAWAMAVVAAISTITHSALPMPGWVERWVLVGPHLHRLHHSAEVAHHDRNFAIFCPWLDRIFGTLHWQDTPPATLGAPDAAYDTRRPLADMARAFRIAASRWRRAPAAPDAAAVRATPAPMP